MILADANLMRYVYRLKTTRSGCPEKEKDDKGIIQPLPGE